MVQKLQEVHDHLAMVLEESFIFEFVGILDSLITEDPFLLHIPTEGELSDVIFGNEVDDVVDPDGGRQLGNCSLVGGLS